MLYHVCIMSNYDMHAYDSLCHRNEEMNNRYAQHLTSRLFRYLVSKYIMCSRIQIEKLQRSSRSKYTKKKLETSENRKTIERRGTKREDG